jgi:hypothetical protein
VTVMYLTKAVIEPRGPSFCQNYCAVVAVK